MINGVLAATIGGLVALVFWGISDWLASKNSKNYSNVEVNMSIHFPGAVILAVIFLLSGQDIPQTNQILTMMLAAGFFTSAYVLFIKALSIGQTGIVVPLINTYPLFTLLASFVFLGIAFSSLKISAMLIIIAGAILLGTERLNKKKMREHFSQEVIMSVLAAIFLGIDFFFLNTVVDVLPWETVASFTAIATAFYIMVLSFIKNKTMALRSLKNLHKNKMGLASGITLTVGAIGFFAGAEISGNLIIPSVIASASVLATSFLARIIDKEKLIITKRIGAIFVVFGVALLNFS